MHLFVPTDTLMYFQSFFVLSIKQTVIIMQNTSWLYLFRRSQQYVSENGSCPLMSSTHLVLDKKFSKVIKGSNLVLRSPLFFIPALVGLYGSVGYSPEMMTSRNATVKCPARGDNGSLMVTYTAPFNSNSGGWVKATTLRSAEAAPVCCGCSAPSKSKIQLSISSFCFPSSGCLSEVKTLLRGCFYIVMTLRLAMAAPEYRGGFDRCFRFAEEVYDGSSGLKLSTEFYSSPSGFPSSLYYSPSLAIGIEKTYNVCVEKYFVWVNITGILHNYLLKCIDQSSFSFCLLPKSFKVMGSVIRRPVRGISACCPRTTNPASDPLLLDLIKLGHEIEVTLLVDLKILITSISFTSALIWDLFLWRNFNGVFHILIRLWRVSHHIMPHSIRYSKKAVFTQRMFYHSISEISPMKSIYARTRSAGKKAANSNAEENEKMV